MLLVTAIQAQDFTKVSLEIIPFGGLVVGDFDGDGIDDFGGIKYDSNNDVMVYHSLGTTPMTFQPITIKPDFSAKGRPAVADFDGDGKLDIVVAKGTNFDLSLLRNVSLDSFTELPLNQSGSSFLYTADLEGDGDTDILGFNLDENNVDMYLNQGNLQFTKTNMATAVDDLEDIAVGDLDGDGDAEIVFIHYSPFGDGENVVVYNNNGDNTFIPVILAQDDLQRSNEVEVGDFNKDGKMDIGVAGKAAFTGFINDGGLNFHKEVLITYPGTSVFGFISSHLVDINNDGAPDAVFGDNDGPTSWFKNTSISPLTYEQRMMGTVAPAYEVLHGDFDGDDDLDLLVSNSELHLYENHVEQLSAVSPAPGYLSLDIYPNPASTAVYFRNALNASLHYQLTGINGNSLQSGQLTKDKLDVSGLKQGVYILKIVDDKTGYNISYKIVKV